MSGVFKSIGKVFKKVIKVAKKVLPYALIGAAAIFTGGAALGLLPTFGTAVGGLVSSLGVGSGLGGILTGAITKAGLGGLAGFALGGKKGMTRGLMAGAALGAMGAATAGTAAAGTVGTAPAANLAGSVTGFATPAEQFVSGAVPSVAAPAAAAIAPTVASGGGLMGMFGSNPLITSQLIQGVGGAIAANADAKERRKAEEREAANFSVSGGLLDPTVMAGGAPAEGGSFDQNKQFKWTYDARQQKLVRAG